MAELKLYDEEMEYLDELDFLGIDVSRYGWTFLIEGFLGLSEEIARSLVSSHIAK